MNNINIKAGTVDVSVVIRIIDSTDGTPETGVVFNTAGIDMWYRRELAASVDITEATLAALTTAHSDGGFLHINDGYYRLDLPDAAVAAGATGVLVAGVVTGMVVIGCYIQLIAYDPFDTVRLGLTAMPNVASGSAGAIITAGTGTAQLNVASGVGDADVREWLGTAAATPTVAGVPEVDVTHYSGTANPTAHTAGYPIVTIKDGTGTGEIDTASGLVTVTAAVIDQIVDEVWDEDATAHQTQGTFGQAIGDPVADTNTIYKGVVTDATGANVAVDVVAVKAETASVQSDTNDIQTRLPAALVSGRMDSNLQAGANNVITDAMVASDVTIASVTGSVGSVTGAVGSVTGAVGSVTVVSDKTGYRLSATGVDDILDEPITEPSAVFAWGGASLRSIIGWVGAYSRNKRTSSATSQVVRNDANSADIATSASSEAAGVVTRDEWV